MPGVGFAYGIGGKSTDGGDCDIVSAVVSETGHGEGKRGRRAGRS